jgi:molecular chaperone GrpE
MTADKREKHKNHGHEAPLPEEAPMNEAQAVNAPAIEAMEAMEAIGAMEAMLGEAAGWQERLTKAEAEREEYLDLAQRVQADFDNFRRRNQSVRAEAVQDGASEVLTQLLPVVDNLERAVEAVSEGEGEQAGRMREGVALVLRQLLDMMGKFGVTEINRPGEPFDPMLENAVTQGAPEEGEPGTVCEVLQKGYRTPNKVLRYAMVKVVAG